MRDRLNKKIHDVWKDTNVYAFVAAKARNDKNAALKAMTKATEAYCKKEKIDIDNRTRAFCNIGIGIEEEQLADQIAKIISSYDEFAAYLKWLDEKEPDISNALYQTAFIDKIGKKLN